MLISKTHTRKNPRRSFTGVRSSKVQSFETATPYTVGETLVEIEAPEGLGYALPFRIFENSVTGAITTDFDKADYDFSATTGVTYYFHTDPVLGLDSNDGLTRLTPKRTINTVNTALLSAPPAGGATFILMTSPGQWYTAQELNISGGPTYKLVMKNGNLDDRPVITTKQSSGHTVTHRAGNRYRTVRSNVAAPIDITWLDEYGKPKRLIRRSNGATVEATPGTYCVVDANTIDFHLWDGRNPIGDATVLQCTSNRVLTVNNNDFYCEGIEFWGAVNDTVEDDSQAAVILTNSNNNPARYVFVDCEFLFSYRGVSYRSNQLTEIIQVRCKARQSFTDGFSYHNKANGLGADGTDINGPIAIEIDCESSGNGYNASGANNGSTMHDCGILISINHQSINNEGRNFSHIDGSKIWKVKCHSEGSPMNYSFQNAGDGELYAWLYKCTSSAPGTWDLLIADSTVRTRGMDTSGWLVSNSNGTLETY